MPIFEYLCDDCGSKFEQLVRRSEANSEANQVRCPSCGHDHLTTQYSTFAARSGSPHASSEAPGGCGAGMCGSDMCQGGMCGMDMN